MLSGDVEAAQATWGLKNRNIGGGHQLKMTIQSTAEGGRSFQHMHL